MRGGKGGNWRNGKKKCLLKGKMSKSELDKYLSQWMLMEVGAIQDGKVTSKAQGNLVNSDGVKGLGLQ